VKCFAFVAYWPWIQAAAVCGLDNVETGTAPPTPAVPTAAPGAPTPITQPPQTTSPSSSSSGKNLDISAANRNFNFVSALFFLILLLISLIMN